MCILYLNKKQDVFLVVFLYKLGKQRCIGDKQTVANACGITASIDNQIITN